MLGLYGGLRRSPGQLTVKIPLEFPPEISSTGKEVETDTPTVDPYYQHGRINTTTLSGAKNAN